uniref:probable carbohydrate esterase At4g34215 n=1 Tax=Erigeron canadensis TaxID=72917 RepID=UPI001CB96A3F|nr:probable carbohydrate esterase At4g34215 [Erigeron canadensis]
MLLPLRDGFSIEVPASGAGSMASHYLSVGTTIVESPRLLLNLGVLLGLVPCAVGGRLGTPISEWEKGSFLYKQLLRRAKVARRAGGSIRALLWYQGESDTVSEVDANMYKRRLLKLFNNLRADLKSPSLAILEVAIASANGPYIEKVRKAQLGIKLKNVKCVDAKGLPLQQDQRHLTTSAQVRLGQMLADVSLPF